ITTTAPHNLAVGNSVTIAGVGVGGYNGIFTVTAVPSPTTFQYTAASSLLANSGRGTATNNTNTFTLATNGATAPCAGATRGLSISIGSGSTTAGLNPVPNSDVINNRTNTGTGNFAALTANTPNIVQTPIVTQNGAPTIGGGVLNVAPKLAAA